MKAFAMILVAALGLAWAGAPRSHADTFDLSWNTVDGGGITFSTGGAWQLGGTAGQPDAQAAPVMSGGVYQLTGGFWPGGVLQYALGDMNCDGIVNNQDIDGFIYALFSRLADYDAYLHSFPTYTPCTILQGDFTGDGLVNNQDIDGFILALFAP